jgi:hypothetical protein
MIGDLVLIETDGTGYMASRIFGIGVTFLRRQIEGSVKDAQIGASDFRLQPIGRDDETALDVAHK